MRTVPPARPPRKPPLLPILMRWVPRAGRWICRRADWSQHITRLTPAYAELIVADSRTTPLIDTEVAACPSAHTMRAVSRSSRVGFVLVLPAQQCGALSHRYVLAPAPKLSVSRSLLHATWIFSSSRKRARKHLTGPTKTAAHKGAQAPSVIRICRHQPAWRPL